MGGLLRQVTPLLKIKVVKICLAASLVHESQVYWERVFLSAADSSCLFHAKLGSSHALLRARFEFTIYFRVFMLAPNRGGQGLDRRRLQHGFESESSP